MKLYVILDRMSKIEYGITDKLWLARLFYIQRFETNNNLVLVHRKSKNTRMLLHTDRWIHYFSGFALLNHEIEYINLAILDAGIGYYRRKYKRKRQQQMLDDVEQSVIDRSIQDCIHRKSDVLDRLTAFHEWQYRIGGSCYDYSY